MKGKTFYLIEGWKQNWSMDRKIYRANDTAAHVKGVY